MALSRYFRIRRNPGSDEFVPVIAVDEDTVSTLTAAIEADIPVLLWGAPGTAKSATIEALGESHGALVITLIGSTMEPSDLGFVIPGEDRTKTIPPDWALDLRDALKHGRPAWLFLDELTTVPPSMQAAFLRLVQERRIGQLSLKGIRVIAAANPPDLAAGAAGDLAAATANRWLHVDWRPVPAKVAEGMRKGWGRPQTPARAAARALVASWLDARPTSMLQVPSEGAQSRGWPSPRSWDALSAGIAALPGSDPVSKAKSSAGYKIAEGLVGEAAATEWSHYVRTMAIPPAIDVLFGSADWRGVAQTQGHALPGLFADVVRTVAGLPLKGTKGTKSKPGTPSRADGVNALLDRIAELVADGYTHIALPTYKMACSMQATPESTAIIEAVIADEPLQARILEVQQQLTAIFQAQKSRG